MKHYNENNLNVLAVGCRKYPLLYVILREVPPGNTDIAQALSIMKLSLAKNLKYL